MSAVGLAAIEAASDVHRAATDGEQETILLSQFADLLRNDEARPPEHRLMLAVLDEAIRSYQRYVSSSRQRGRRLFREAEEWFASDAATWPFSFVVICETLDLEPDYVRAGLRAWRTANVSVAGRGAPMIRFRTRAVAGSRHQLMAARARTPAHLRRTSRRRGATLAAAPLASGVRAH